MLELQAAIADLRVEDEGWQLTLGPTCHFSVETEKF